MLLLHNLPFNSIFEKKFKKLKDLGRFCQPLVYAFYVGLEERSSTILDEKLFNAKNHSAATLSHPYLKLKWFLSESRKVAFKFLEEEARKAKIPKLLTRLIELRELATILVMNILTIVTNKQPQTIRRIVNTYCEATVFGWWRNVYPKMENAWRYYV